MHNIYLKHTCTCDTMQTYYCMHRCLGYEVYIWMYMSIYKFLTRNNIPKAIPFSVSASVSQIICQAMWPSAFVVVVQSQGDGAGVLRFWAYVPRQKLLCHAYLDIQLEVSTVTYRYSWDSWVPATIVKPESGICAEKAQADTFFLLPFSIISSLHLIDFLWGTEAMSSY